MVSAEAKGRFISENAPMQIGDNIFVTQGLYKGTPPDLEAVRDLSKTPGFLEKYPNHTVFVDGTVVVGALPLDPNVRKSPEYQDMRDRLNAKLRERNIRAVQCAIIRTGQVAPAPEPTFVSVPPSAEPGVLFRAPTR